MVGCASVPAIPPNRLPRELLAEPRSDLQKTSLTRLRQDEPDEYRLGPNDTLGIYIETVLGEADQEIPVTMNREDERPPSLGYPVVVSDSGTIDLPFIAPLPVSGLTIDEAREAIRQAYTVDQKILPEGRDRILVSLLRPRTYRVLVIREDLSEVPLRRSSVVLTEGLKRGSGFLLNLPAYENDVLTALTETGGMPGEDAKNEITILRGGFIEAERRDELISMMRTSIDECSVPPEDPAGGGVVRIPLRFRPDDPPHFSEEDITLESGDIVVINSRDTDVFYIGGILDGKEIPLPRDRDLDVLEALALGGGSVGGAGTGLGNLGRGGIFNTIRRQGGFGVPPTRCIIIRKTANGAQVPIRVNLKKAMVNPDENVLIAPGDMVMLQYNFVEELGNAVLGVFSISWRGELFQAKEL